MVDSEYSPDNYRSLKISAGYNRYFTIGSIVKYLEKLRFDPDHLQTKKMCKHAVKNCRS